MAAEVLAAVPGEEVLVVVDLVAALVAVALVGAVLPAAGKYVLHEKSLLHNFFIDIIFLSS